MTLSKPAAALAALAVALGPLAAQASISEPAHQALLRALDDEYHAQAVYDAVIAKFGAVRPFSNIRNAEQMHQSLVAQQLQANGYAVPPNPYTSGQKPVGALPGTLAEACAVGVQAEIANAALYDNELLPAVAGYPQLTATLTKLRDDSATKHLPAFQRCGGGGGGQGQMRGGNGQGHGPWWKG